MSRSRVASPPDRVRAGRGAGEGGPASGAAGHRAPGAADHEAEERERERPTPSDGRRRPNLFIIGAPKCGTTSLHHWLGAHSDIFMCEPKEPGFFVPELDAYPKDTAWYLGLFAEAGKARYAGESSTHYTKLPTYRGVPGRIAAFCEEPRFIYLMRDPIDRAISQYWHGVRQLAEGRDIVTAMREDVEYTAFSDYRMQLEPYFETFGRERVLVLTFEELVATPRRVVDRVFAWLGLPREDAPRSFTKHNVRPEEFPMLRFRGIFYRLALTRAWEWLSPRAPRPVRRLARRLAYREVHPDEVPADEVIELLRPAEREKVRELERFLGRSFPAWKTTLGGDRGRAGP